MADNLVEERGVETSEDIQPVDANSERVADGGDEEVVCRGVGVGGFGVYFGSVVGFVDDDVVHGEMLAQEEIGC